MTICQLKHIDKMDQNCKSNVFTRSFISLCYRVLTCRSFTPKCNLLIIINLFVLSLKFRRIRVWVLLGFQLWVCHFQVVIWCRWIPFQWRLYDIFILLTSNYIISAFIEIVIYHLSFKSTVVALVVYTVFNNYFFWWFFPGVN